MENNVEYLLKKYYKNYLEGKKIFNIDKDKSFDYFKESLSILNNLKSNYTDKIKKYSKILDETEKETFTLINETVEYYMESEISNSNDINYLKIFKSIDIGNILEIKKYKYNEIDFKKLFNNQSILHHAIKIGDTTFLKYCFKIGAKIDTPNGNGNNLLEYACLEKDPNMINFLIKNGACIKKNLFLRKSQIKHFIFNDYVDISNLIKIIIEYNNKIEFNNIFIDNYINKIKKLVNLEELIGFNNLTINDLLNLLKLFLNNMDPPSTETYLNIIYEELTYDIKIKLGCPKSKIDIILINLLPFINYPFNLSIDWVISYELKFLIIKFMKNQNLKNINIIKEELVDELWSKYIKKEIIQEEYLGTLIFQWIAKIKV